MNTILIVDDEEKILDIISSYLLKNSYTVLTAKTGRQALDVFFQNDISLVILDLMLPDFSGELVCRKIREKSNVPIIMLTAKVDENSIINGLNIGADDYVTKPFSPRQLMARVNAKLRTLSNTIETQKANIISVGKLTIDTENKNVKLNGSSINLTRKEFNILSLLAAYPQKIFTRDEIIENALGDDFDGFDRAVDTHIKKLRAKIGGDLISTVYGMGYRLGQNDD